MNLKLQKFAPPIFIALMPLLLFWRLVYGGEVLYWGLPLYQFYPWHTLVVEAIRSGHLPLWTDLLGNGTPLLANHQSAAFYPLNLIYLVAPVEQAMGYSVVLHLIMAGLFAYAWGRTIGLSRFGATVSGLSFMLSGFFESRTQFVTIINGAAWLPLLFLLAERLIRRRTLLDVIWLGVALALQFLAGHAQLWFYSLWVVAAYVVARAWSQRREQPGVGDSRLALAWPRRRRVFALLVGAFILSGCLSAVQLLPTAELALHSQRAGGLDPDEAMTYSFWPWRLLTLVAPDLFGSPATGDYWGYATYWEDAGYVGVLPLLLASSIVLSVARGAMWREGRRWLLALSRLSFALLGRGEREAESPELETRRADGRYEGFLVAFFLVLIFLSLILAMGQNTPVYPLVFKYVPGFGAFRAPARFILFYTFGVSTLAGMGADRFRLTYRSQYVARLTVAGAAAMLAVSLAAGRMGLAIKPTFAPAVTRFALWWGFSSILLLLCPGRMQPGLGPGRMQPGLCPGRMQPGLCPGPTGPGPGAAQTRLSRAQIGLRGRGSDDTDHRVARSPLPIGIWRGLVICFVTVDLALFAAPLTPTIDPTLYRTTTDVDRFFLARADSDRLFATYDYDYDAKFSGFLDFSDWGPSDLVHWLSFRETLVPNLNVFSRTPSVNNDDPLAVGRWRDLTDKLRNADWSDRLRLLRMMNVGYVLAESQPPGLSAVENMPHLYRLAEPFPRAWVVSQARVIPASADLPSELMADTFDPTNEVLLEATPSPVQFSDLDFGIGDRPTDQSPSASATHPEPSPVASSLREEGNSRTIDLVVSQPGYLVLAYTYYPGWRATVDGQPTELLRANYAFMAMPLESGQHRVILRYRPVSLMLGVLISGLSVLVVIGVVALRMISKSKNRGE